MTKIETTDETLVELVEQMKLDGIDPSVALRAGIQAVVDEGTFFSKPISGEKNLCGVGA